LFIRAGAAVTATATAKNETVLAEKCMLEMENGEIEIGNRKVKGNRTKLSLNQRTKKRKKAESN
jgi:hypothetical protein